MLSTDQLITVGQSRATLSGAKEKLCYTSKTLRDHDSKEGFKVHLVEVDEAKRELKQLIDETLAGGEVLITHDHHPLVRLVKAEPEECSVRSIGSARELIEIHPDFDEPLEEFLPYSQ